MYHSFNELCTCIQLMDKGFDAFSYQKYNVRLMRFLGHFFLGI